MAPSPVHADIVLPLGKNGKGNHQHVFETTVSKTNEDVDCCTPEQLAIVEAPIILSCNESHHDAKTFHTYNMEQMAIKEATHGPMFEVEKTFLRALGSRYDTMQCVVPRLWWRSLRTMLLTALQIARLKLIIGTKRNKLTTKAASTLKSNMEEDVPSALHSGGCMG